MSKPTTFDQNALTGGEMAQIEELSGQSMTAMADPDLPKARLLMAMAYVWSRRSNPALTFNEVEAWTVAEIAAVIQEEPDPKAKS